MSSLASWCYRRRGTVLAAWVTVLVALVLAVVTAGTSFTTVADLPDSESATAYELLAEMGQGSGTAQGRVVWHADGVAIDAPSVQAEVAAMLDEVAALPGVEAVVSPYTDAGAGQLNATVGTAFATVVATDAVDVAEVRAITDAYDSAVLEVAAGGQALSELPSPSHGMEVVGILAAFALLFAMFRSWWAAVLPIATGVTGVGVSLLGVMLLSHVMDLDSTSLTMGALIGLGVGIDYALFIVNRFRTALTAGAAVSDAVRQAVSTSGRAVVLAGLTVIVALLGMAVVGLGVLTGMGQAAALTVLLTVLAAITLLPALLGALGHRVLSKRQRAERAGAEQVAGRAGRPRSASRWALRVQRSPRVLAVAAIGVLVVLALPATSMRVGSSDATSDPVGSPTREYADLVGPAFGAGLDATLVLAAEIPDAAAAAAFDALVGDLPSVPGVASVVAAPVQPGRTVALAAVTPTTSAQTRATQDLVDTLRSEVIPAAEQGSALQVYVGGETATNIDLSEALMGRLPLYLALVALLGFLLLSVAFRSVLVPLVGALSNLATIAVGLGVITALFQFGWAGHVLGVGDAAPTMYIVPVILVGVVFGLSMDYQVFLVSRMHEEWTRTHDNGRAIRVGTTETARVIATAATIMLAVFASFSFGGERIVSAIGLGLGAAVLVDAFVVRLTLVPALMRLIGDRNWAYPRWADRITPHVSVEGADSDAAGPGAAAVDTRVLEHVGTGTDGRE
ncbi:MMPL family transporter [Actinotalea sp. M2MS4P-6]|uniref:MMPL family transporter n=1 Tax=Actinotalea sp. M2MS4P-6 TaxID=2983762 RepID=UPI0021E4E5F1|nr:MMPL family transporter [Actinotalea sp. M2MS4P-6]MCV2395691.1 MMPL family transporter [Actinotalea sp. M2MS4P-6]